MPEARDAALTAFLDRAGWGEARSAVLAGDASNRRYDRLTAPTGETAVLMDAPPDRGEDVRPFTAIARHLIGQGLAAPRILSEEPEAGFLLLEDFGDSLFASVLTARPELERTLYDAATDVLVALHRGPLPNVARYRAEMPDLAMLAWRWYRMEVDGTAPQTGPQPAEEMAAALDALPPEPDVLILRDYHAQNLIWRPDRVGLARVGLLDFQDARAGHPAYDLVSLVEDARRDVPQTVADAAVARFVAATGRDSEAFRQGLAVIGAQRNLRILGTFARLSMHFGKPSYVDMMPRIWAYLEQDLSHPACSRLRDLVRRDLPPPDPAHLRTLKDKCATIPHR